MSAPTDRYDVQSRVTVPDEPAFAGGMARQGLMVCGSPPPAGLVKESLDALAAYSAASDAATAAREQLTATVHPKVDELLDRVIILFGLVNDRDTGLMVAEMIRHAPPLAGIIRLVWEHVADAKREDVGRCCMGEIALPAHRRRSPSIDMGGDVR